MILPLDSPMPGGAVLLCRNGIYWCAATARRGRRFPCVTAQVRMVTVEQVAATFEGPAQDRAVALSTLTEAIRLLLYPSECACGKNHFINVRNLVRAWKNITPNLRELCAALPVHEYIKVAGIHGDTDEETQQKRIMHIAQYAFRSTTLLDGVSVFDVMSMDFASAVRHVVAFLGTGSQASG